jgi:hypothetical protein
VEVAYEPDLDRTYDDEIYEHVTEPGVLPYASYHLAAVPVAGRQWAHRIMAAHGNKRKRTLCV